MIETIDQLIKRLQVHPAATAFPMLSAAEHKELKADVEKRGFTEPIVIAGDYLLDGRNRLKVAGELGITPKVVQYRGNDPVGEVISRNIRRRHLTDDQRVAIVAKLRGEEIEKEAAESQKSALKKGKTAGTKAAKKGESAKRIAEEAEVSGSKGRAALAAKKHAPGALEEVISGKKKLSAAKKEAAAAKTAKDKAAGKTAAKKKEEPLKDRVEKKFRRFLESFAVSEYKEVRAIVRDLVATADKKGQGAIGK